MSRRTDARPSADRAGMTLLELVVGLAVTGLALAGGYAALASVLDHRTHAERVTAAVARDAAVRQALASWLAGARLTAEEGGPPFQGLDAVRGDRADAELVFMTGAGTPLGVGNTVVRLFIDRDECTPEAGLVAELREWGGVATMRIEMEPRATALRIRYQSDSNGEHQWVRSWVSSSVLPVGIELSLHPAAHDSLPPLLQFPILVSLAGPR